MSFDHYRILKFVFYSKTLLNSFLLRTSQTPSYTLYVQLLKQLSLLVCLLPQTVCASQAKQKQNVFTLISTELYTEVAHNRFSGSVSAYYGPLQKLLLPPTPGAPVQSSVLHFDSIWSISLSEYVSHLFKWTGWKLCLHYGLYCPFLRAMPGMQQQLRNTASPKLSNVSMVSKTPLGADQGV